MFSKLFFYLDLQYFDGKSIFLFIINVVGSVLVGYLRKDVKNIFGNNAYKSGFVGYMLNKNTDEKLFLIDTKEKNKLEITIPKEINETK